MPEEIKRFLGRWYRRWLQYAQQPGNNKKEEDDETVDPPRGRQSSRENITSPH
jgi:hypothetical protein